MSPRGRPRTNASPEPTTGRIADRYESGFFTVRCYRDASVWLRSQRSGRTTLPLPRGHHCNGAPQRGGHALCVLPTITSDVRIRTTRLFASVLSAGYGEFNTLSVSWQVSCAIYCGRALRARPEALLSSRRSG